MDWTVDWTMNKLKLNMSSTHAHKLAEKMEDACSQCFSGRDDVIVLSSDETQDEEDKERLLKVGSKVGRIVRRRLLQNEEITKFDSLAASFGRTFGDRNGCSSGEDLSDNGSPSGGCSDDLTVTQFESPTKKVFTPTKKPRIGTPSDCSDDDEAEKEGFIRCLLIYRVLLCTYKNSALWEGGCIEMNVVLGFCLML